MGLLLESAEIGAKLLKKHGKEAYDTFMRYVDNGYPVEVSERVASGELPMDTASKMQRAREQGYDIDEIWYHGSPDRFLEFSPDSIQKRFDASIGHHFSNAEGEAKHYAGIGGNVGDYLVKGGRQIEYNIDDNPIEASNFITASMKADLDRDRIVEDILNGGFDSALISKTMPESWQDWGAVNKNLIKMDNEGIRSYSSAAFDPEYKGSNILGSLAATGGALGLLAPEDAEAGTAKASKEVLKSIYEAGKDAFIGKPTITSNKNASQLRVNPHDDIFDYPEMDLPDSDYTIRQTPYQSVIFDGDKPIAAYDKWNTLVVDPKYRKKGIGTELVYQRRTAFPDQPPAEYRTRAAQKAQKAVWDRIAREAQQGSADPGLLAATAAGGTAAATSPSWMDTANQYAGQALEAIDMPYKGYLGLSRLAGGLLSGEGLDTALNESVKQIRQPIEQTAMESGDEVLKRTGSPEAATLWNLIMQMGSPI